MRVARHRDRHRASPASAVVDGDQVARRASLSRMRGSHARTLLPLIDDGARRRRLRAARARSARGVDRPRVVHRAAHRAERRQGAGAGDRRCRVVGVPTLEALRARRGAAAGSFCPVLDARKGEVYAAAFRWQRRGSRAAVRRRAGGDRAERVRRVAADAVHADRRRRRRYGELWRGALGDAAELMPFADAAAERRGRRALGVARLRAVGRRRSGRPRAVVLPADRKRS